MPAYMPGQQMPMAGMVRNPGAYGFNAFQGQNQLQDAMQNVMRENWRGNPYSQAQARMGADRAQSDYDRMMQMMMARSQGGGNVGGRQAYNPTASMLAAMFGGGGGGGLPGF